MAGQDRSEAQARVSERLKRDYRRQTRLKFERIKAGKREARRAQNNYRAMVGLPLLPEVK